MPERIRKQITMSSAQLVHLLFEVYEMGQGKIPYKNFKFGEWVTNFIEEKCMDSYY